MPSVKYSDLEMAVSFVGSGYICEADAYLSRKSGKIYWVSSELDDEDLPEDWYKFENSATKTALCEWARDEGFTVESTGNQDI